MELIFVGPNLLGILGFAAIALACYELKKQWPTVIRQMQGHKPKIAGHGKFWTEIFNVDPKTATKANILLNYSQMYQFFASQPHFAAEDLAELQCQRDTALSAIDLRDYMRQLDREQREKQKETRAYQKQHANNKTDNHSQHQWAGNGSRSVNWREVLGVGSNVNDWATVQKAFRAKVAKNGHPDRGGNADVASKLGEAYSLAKAELKAA